MAQSRNSFDETYSSDSDITSSREGRPEDGTEESERSRRLRFDEYFRRYHTDLDVLDKRSKHLKSSLEFLKNNDDSEKISRYLFGVSLKKSDSVLSHFVHVFKLYNDLESQKVRKLLMKSSLLYKRLPKVTEVHLGANINRGIYPSCLTFDIDVKKYPFDTKELKQLYRSFRGLNALIDPIIKIHQSYKSSQTFHRPTTMEFFDFATLVETFLQTTKGPSLNYPIAKPAKTLKVEFDSETYRIQPCGYMNLNDEPRIIVECLPFPSFPKELNNDIKLDMEVLRSPLKQLAGFMLLSEAPVGVLFDGNIMLCVEIDHNIKVETQNPCVPLKVSSTNVKATGPTFIECLISLQLKGMAGSRDQMRGLKNICFTSHLTQEPNGDPTPGHNGAELREFEEPYSFEEGFYTDLSEDEVSIEEPIPKILLKYKEYSVIKAGHSKYQVFKVAALKAPFLENVDPRDQVVLRIHDPEMSFDRWIQLKIFRSASDYLGLVYGVERRCVRRLSKDPEFNNCFLSYSPVFAEVITPIGRISGKCLLSKYIESVPIPKDEETYEKVKKQLNVVHKHGITLNGHVEHNVLYSKEGKVYIISFEMADLKEDSYDEESLNYMFGK